jgi:hypothetical protein
MGTYCHCTDCTILALNYMYIYIYIYIYLIQKLISSLIVITSKLFLRFPMIKSLLNKVTVLFTPCSKCQHTGTVQSCNVTDSFHVLCSSFFTNHRTIRCYTLCCSLPHYINRKQNKDTAKLCKLSSRFAPF